LILEKAFGIGQRRPFPEFSHTRFDKWFFKRPCRERDRRVVLFHDTFMNYFEPEIGISATELLEAAGFEVLLIPNRKCCGRPFLSGRMTGRARKTAEYNLRLLAPHADAGLPIICCEPSCMSMLMEEYPKLCNTETARRVAEGCVSLEEFLVKEFKGGRLALSFTDEPRQLLFHAHCHQKYFVGTDWTLQALGLPQNYEPREIPTTCCGMAGSNGFEREHYERSLQAAEVSLLPVVRQAAPNVEIVASGTSCRQQILHGCGRIARHPAVVLREALIQK
jgi:Fe-S oxidoreductase